MIPLPEDRRERDRKHSAYASRVADECTEGSTAKIDLVRVTDTASNRFAEDDPRAARGEQEPGFECDRGRSQWTEKTLGPTDVCETKLLPGFKLPCRAVFEAAGEEGEE